MQSQKDLIQTKWLRRVIEKMSPKQILNFYYLKYTKISSI